MAKKLYYDDPLQAAYMAKEFGVILHLSNCSDLSPTCGYWFDLGNNPDHIANDVYELYQGNEVKRAHIHPDSYHIFNAKDGDKNIEGYTFSGRLGMWCINGESKAFIGHKDIDKRNNKPFFTPLIEDKTDV